MTKILIFDLDSTLAPIGLGMVEEEYRVDKNCKSTLEMLKFFMKYLENR